MCPLVLCVLLLCIIVTLILQSFNSVFYDRYLYDIKSLLFRMRCSKSNMNLVRCRLSDSSVQVWVLLFCLMFLDRGSVVLLRVIGSNFFECGTRTYQTSVYVKNSRNMNCRAFVLEECSKAECVHTIFDISANFCVDW